MSSVAPMREGVEVAEPTRSHGRGALARRSPCSSSASSRSVSHGSVIHAPLRSPMRADDWRRSRRWPRTRAVDPRPRVLGQWRSTRRAFTTPSSSRIPRATTGSAVNALPLVVVAGRPLWQLGGARAAVLLPVLSVVLAAYAARRRVSRWASGGDGWLALWFVGLLSPVLFYGADFWEHAPALALAPARGRIGAGRWRAASVCSAA